jgi:hypothetical protein
MTTNSNTAGFFCIDRGAFRCAAAGGLNSAIAHLIMARGTGRDNRTTQWSVNAIEKYTGISRPNAKKAVQDLLQRGIWRKTRDGNHPIYEAVPANEVPGGPFTAMEQAAIAAIRDGNSSADSVVLAALEARGIVREYTNRRASRQRYELDDVAVAEWSGPFSIWLPNALIDGAGDEVAPIELVRQTRSVLALRLLIELYAEHFLPSFGGVPREILKQQFERLHVGQRGSFVVWGFKATNLRAGPKLARPFFTGTIKTRNDETRLDSGWDKSFWPAIETLKGLGLIEAVGMLLDGEDAEAEIIHPYGVNGGEPAECELARAAGAAAAAMVTEAQLSRAEAEGYPYLVPVQRHIAKVALVEVFRLRYRPHTTATAAWYAMMKESTTEWLAAYEAIIKERANRQTTA